MAKSLLVLALALVGLNNGQTYASTRPPVYGYASPGPAGYGYAPQVYNRPSYNAYTSAYGPIPEQTYGSVKRYENRAPTVYERQERQYEKNGAGVKAAQDKSTDSYNQGNQATSGYVTPVNGYTYPGSGYNQAGGSFTAGGSAGGSAGQIANMQAGNSVSRYGPRGVVIEHGIEFDLETQAKFDAASKGEFSAFMDGQSSTTGVESADSVGLSDSNGLAFKQKIYIGY